MGTPSFHISLKSRQIAIFKCCTLLLSALSSLLHQGKWEYYYGQKKFILSSFAPGSTLLLPGARCCRSQAGSNAMAWVCFWWSSETQEALSCHGMICSQDSTVARLGCAAQVSNQLKRVTLATPQEGLMECDWMCRAMGSRKAAGQLVGGWRGRVAVGGRHHSERAETTSRVSSCNSRWKKARW